jgi:PAS domain S-box-containing protein
VQTGYTSCRVGSIESLRRLITNWFTRHAALLCVERYERSPPPRRVHDNRRTHLRQPDRSEYRWGVPKVLLYAAAIVAGFSADSLVDSIAHPDLPFFDLDHTIVGSVVALLIILLIFVFERFGRRTLASERIARRITAEWQSTFDAVDNAIILLDRHQHILRNNRTAERMFGYSAEQLTGKDWRDVVGGVDQTASGDRFSQMENSRLRVSWELARDDRWLEINLDPLYDDTQLLRGAILIAGDITRRKHADQASHESRERSRLLADHMLDVLFSTDMTGTITYVSPSVRSIFRCDPDVMVGKHFTHFLAPEDKQKAEKTFAGDIARGQPAQSLMLTLLRADGTTCMGELSASILKDDRGAIVGTMGLIRDISERKKTEDRLKSSEEEYRVLFMSNPVPMWVYDRESLAIMAVNDFAVSHYGYSREEFLRMTLKDIRPPEQIPEMYDRIRAVQGKVRAHTGICHRKKNGTVITVDITAHPLTFESRPAMLVMATDVTEQRKAAGAIEKSRELLLQSQRVAQLGHYEFFPQSGTWTTSDMLNDIFGIDADFARTVEGWLTIVHPDDRALMTRHLQEHVIRDHQAFDMEYRINRQNDGAVRWVHGLGQLEFDVDGKPAKMFGTIQDITDRKLTEERIEQQARLLDVAHDAILVRDMSDKLLYMNRAAETLYGWSLSEGLDLPSSLLLSNMRRDVYESIMKPFVARGEWEGELRQKTKAGKEIIVQSRWTLVRDEQGRPSARLIINRDMTEQRQLEARLRRTQRLESLGTLAGGIAHDLNNVLAPILLSLALLHRKVKDPDILRLLSSLEKGAERGSEIVKQVLLFARGTEKDFSPQQLRYVIKEVITIINETFPRNIELHTALAPDLAFIRGDATQIHQVLLNLCVNARDAMPQGGALTLKAENLVVEAANAAAHGSLQPGPYVLVTIADTGTGIPRDLQEKIFEPFFTTKEVGKGTGLGLSTAYAILKDHKAHIILDSEAGAGATFRLYFPAIEHQEEKAEPEATTGTMTGNGECILVVDDEQGIQAVTRTILETHGYKVILAGNGRDAVSIVEADNAPKVDAVIMDINMPGMNGIDAAKEIKRIAPRIKIVFASGMMTEIESIDTKRLIFSGYLMKPYRTERMLAMLHDVLTEPPAASR